MTDVLTRLGVSQHLLSQAEKKTDYSLGRIIEQHHTLYHVQTENAVVCAKLLGKMSYVAEDPLAFPAVGDWVFIDATNKDQDHYMIRHILERKSLLKRKSSDHSHHVQVMVANVDVAFICMALNRDYNLRRLERYLALVWDSGVKPVIILTKADVSTDLQDQLAGVHQSAPGVEVIISSPYESDVITRMQQYIRPHQTAVLLGSSGVGKSTLINRLMGDSLTKTTRIRQDGKGRHTTTTRHLFQIPGGGIVIDTPGLRALQLDVSTIDHTFTEIKDLISRCKYRDCRHQAEPGCAITHALLTGDLSQGRWESYQKLQKEQKYAGLNSKKIEGEKIKTMFGGKKAYKQKMTQIQKKKNFL